MSFKAPSSISKPKWLQGLQTLNRLWERGLLPEDLEKHYFLHWFVVYSGNILKTAQALQIHRNTIQGHFLSLGFSRKSVLLRHQWQAISHKNPRFSFEKNFFIYYSRFGKKPFMSIKENNRLIGLWQTKFPYKTLVAHYLLWSQRAGKSKEWVRKKLGYSFRHRARLLSQLVHLKCRDGFWLSPLKPISFNIRSARPSVIPRWKK